MSQPVYTTQPRLYVSSLNDLLIADNLMGAIRRIPLIHPHTRKRHLRQQLIPRVL
jgi:hypothetical protein